MSDNSEPPIIEVWRIAAVVLIVLAGMVFAYAIDPPRAGAVAHRPVAASAVAG